MEATAKGKFIRVSPRKIRLVIDLVRGMDVLEALSQLQFSKKAAALPLAKIIKSAIANAEESYQLKKDNLFIKTIFVDGGPTLKRWMPKAMGRATPIRKRTSHINLILSEKQPTAEKLPVKKEPISKDDIIKLSDIDELKTREKESGDKDDFDSGKKAETSKFHKGERKRGFTKKFFNRKSG